MIGKTTALLTAVLRTRTAVVGDGGLAVTTSERASDTSNREYY